MADNKVVHRSGVFKQPNKTHKTGRHRSKGLINKEAKGRKEVTIEKISKKIALNKKDRINKLNQVRKMKREAIILEKRNRGGLVAPPFLVVVASLNSTVLNSLLDIFKTCSDIEILQKQNGAIWINSIRFKQRFEFVFVHPGDINYFLDSCLVADTLIFLLPTEGQVIDKWGELLLTSIFSQGLPSTIFISMNYSNIAIKKLVEFKKSIMKPLANRFPDHKLMLVDTDQDVHMLLRNIANQKLSNLKYQESRPHLFIDCVSFEDKSNDKCIAKIRGYLRGAQLACDQLIQVCGWGRYQILQINDFKNAQYGDQSKLIVDKTYFSIPSQQESLQCEVQVDPMQDEQTWPTEQELFEADHLSKKTIKKIVPKGSSDYQATWLDFDDEEENMNDNEDELNSIDDDFSNEESEIFENESSDMMSTNDHDENYDNNFDSVADLDDLSKYKELRMQEMFPDEIDTPMNIQARVRFQKFRGLKSFLTSQWDSRENLPNEYLKITKFPNYKSMCKKIITKKKSDDLNIIDPGGYVEIHIMNVESKYSGLDMKLPTIAIGLLPFEQRMTVMHFVIRRSPLDRKPVKSKELMSFRVGGCSFISRPIFSQHTNGSKHKFEKFFPLDGVLVATVYAPLIISPAPVIMFRRTLQGKEELVGTGTVLSADPDRIIVKRIVLSGHPYKINKRSVVVRYMFFNKEDILWFKPVELRTKYGRRGHIREPLGTHGHMKCVFDSQLKSQDTVLLNLYKRVFPKWFYEPLEMINLADNFISDLN